MNDLSDLVEWLKSGVADGHITADEAFAWVSKRAEAVAPSRLRPMQPTVSQDVETLKAPRLKKDGTPRAKPGRKKQLILPTVEASK